jgi:hypothetical protein
MKLNTPDYQLVRMAEHEWRFQTSAELDVQTEKFDAVLERHAGTGKLTSALRRFLNEHPGHIDALHHYAMCKLQEAKSLDGYAFAQTAVATGRRAFPRQFDPARDTLPGGWLENRPFLRALHGLMEAQESVFDQSGAIATGLELLVRDPQDRMGARLELPEMMLSDGRTQEALELFARPEFEGTFDTAVYLEALARLRSGDDEGARKALTIALRNHPQVARFLLEPTGEPPEEGMSPFGMVSGSPCEGWFYADRYRWLWREPAHAMKVLRQAAEPVARAGWERWLDGGADS